MQDMQMPVMDGCEAAQQIRKTYNLPCHIIALTAKYAHLRIVICSVNC